MSTVPARVLTAGSGKGPVLRLQEPLSFWGGVDPESGRIIERRHPQAGRSVTGTILAMSHARGSSSSPSVLAEMIRLGTAPAGVLLENADPMVVVGALVAEELYGTALPVCVLSHRHIADAVAAEIRPDGSVKIH